MTILDPDSLTEPRLGIFIHLCGLAHPFDINLLPPLICK